MYVGLAISISLLFVLVMNQTNAQIYNFTIYQNAAVGFSVGVSI
jgi:hypothetical protein